jgi:transcriptional regulator with XRE-family HTH domain
VAVSVNTNTVFAMRRVGEQLQRLRLSAGLKQDDTAAELGISRHMVSRFERGKALPSQGQLRTLLRACGASVEERASITAQFEHAKSYGRAWWEEPRFHAIFQGDSYRYFSLEDAAEHISMHSGTYIPGLLQTGEYIEALAAFGQKDESADTREAFVAARQQRQGILTRRNPVFLDALCSESALRAVVGGRDVMRGQIHHLLACMKRQNVTLRIIPFTAGVTSIFAYLFTIIDFPGTDVRSAVSQELTGSTKITDDPAEVRRNRRAFSGLTEHALDHTETVRLLKEIEDEFQ